MLKIANNDDSKASFLVWLCQVYWLAIDTHGVKLAAHRVKLATHQGKLATVLGTWDEQLKNYSPLPPPPPPQLGRGPLLVDGKPPSAGSSEAAGLPESLGPLHCPRYEGKLCTW